MMLLSSKLHMLPAHPSDEDKTHEVGIDRLNNLPCGYQAIEALFDIADELNYCPDHNEVVWLGKIVLRTNIELNGLLAKRRRDRTHIQDRKKKRIAPIRTTGLIGFTRGN